ncbi:MAG: metal-dependent hydrolase [Desulfococcaceae bacterium]
MDPLTQGVVGAVFAGGLAPREQTRMAAIIGFLTGMLADLDVVITRADDPMFSLLIHRHFTHALVFIPVGGLIGALLLWPFFRNRLPFVRLLMFSTAGYATAGIIDACTSYGTYLYWPLSDRRVAWDLISIIDPVFTGGLLIALLVAAIRRRPQAARSGVLFMLIYLSLGMVQRDRAAAALREVAEVRGHAAERIAAKPSLFNLLLWRGLYEAGDEIHVDAIRVGFGLPEVYPGGRAKKFDPAELPEGIPPDSAQARDIERFVHFSDRWVARHPDQPDLLGDLRYGALPDSIYPIWGIRLNPDRPERHAPFVHLRKADREMLATFIRMVGGRSRQKKEAS